MWELKKNFIKLYVLMLTVFGICTHFCMYKNKAMAASGLRIYNYTTKKEYTYTDAQIKVTYNGKKISKDSTPGILQNGIALVPYKDIFANSEIKASCVYDKKAGTVSISKFGTTIVLTIGSTKAYINGKEVTAPVAPVKIQYVKENVTKILVPSRFVSENLGYKYTWYKDTSTVAIERDTIPLHLSYNNGEPFYYTSTQGKVTIDGKAVDLGNMPSIIVNNTAMLRAKKVFADSSIKADYQYNSKDRTITLTKNGNVLKMKIESPVAYLNGNAFELDTAPMIVKNLDTGVSFVMVPGSVTASCLGYDYRWDNNTKTSIITSRQENIKETHDDKKQTTDNKQSTDKKDSSNQSQNNAPELGDSPVTWDAGKILFQWETPNNKLAKSNGVQNINNGKSDDKGYLYTVARDYSKVNINSETYAIYGNIPFSEVTSSVTGNQINLNIYNLTTIDTIYSMQNQSDGILNSVRTSAYGENNSRLEFNLTKDQFTYDLSLSPDKYTLYLTIYYNILNKVIIGSNGTMDYITLTGNYPIDAVVNRNNNIVTVTLPGIKKGFEDQFVNLFDSLNLYYASVYSASNGTLITIGLKESLDYYIAQDGKSYTIMFPSKDKPFTPVTPAQPSDSDRTDSVVPDYPEGYEIVIPNPAGLSLNQIEDEDQYYNLRFSVRLPGDYVSYFDKYPIQVKSSVIKDVSVFLNTQNKTEILVSTSKIQGYKIYADKNYIYIKVANPKDIYKNIVVLDPGHGGGSPGAIYNNTYEKMLNLKILYEIGKEFFDSDPDKLKVYYTRVTDVDISLSDRAAFAQKVGADLFVSLHMNANTNKSVTGTEVYYSASNNKKNKAGLNSETLAKLFVNSLSKALNTTNRGTRAEVYTVVHKNTVPAVLIELGFMSNQNELRKLTDSEFQYKAAKTIYETLLQVFESYPTGR